MTAVAKEFCLISTDYCLTMQEWSVWWQALSVVAAVVVGLCGIIKIIHELRRLNEQREKDIFEKESALRLNRTKFFLEQHRRLFDNPELYEITCLLDSDHPALANEKMWDKKRKFLTFIEEMALLVESGQINNNVAYYMFGYYAQCAKNGDNFQIGIDASKEYWGLFFNFVEKYEEYLFINSGHPPKLSL